MSANDVLSPNKSSKLLEYASSNFLFASVITKKYRSCSVKLFKVFVRDKQLVVGNARELFSYGIHVGFLLFLCLNPCAFLRSSCKPYVA